MHFAVNGSQPCILGVIVSTEVCGGQYYTVKLSGEVCHIVPEWCVSLHLMGGSHAMGRHLSGPHSWCGSRLSRTTSVMDHHALVRPGTPSVGTRPDLPWGDLHASSCHLRCFLESGVTHVPCIPPSAVVGQWQLDHARSQADSISCLVPVSGFPRGTTVASSATQRVHGAYRDATSPLALPG